MNPGERRTTRVLKLISKRRSRKKDDTAVLEKRRCLGFSAAVPAEKSDTFSMHVIDYYDYYEFDKFVEASRHKELSFILHISILSLGRAAKDLVTSANTRANFIILGFRVAGSVEVGLHSWFSLCQQQVALTRFAYQ